MLSFLKCGLAVLLASTMLLSLGQEPTKAPPDLPLSASERGSVIESVLDALSSRYVFPELATKMVSAIHDRVKRQEYDRVASSQELAQKLTEHLQAVSHDKHLRVVFRIDPLPIRADEDTPPTALEMEEMRREEGSVNFGFECVRRLEGNIGYLDLRSFTPPDLAAEVSGAAMKFLERTDALIIDLRENGGGDPAMVALMCSYLFGPEPVHLNDIYLRPSDRTEQFWTLREVPGPRCEKKDVYVLTSSYTFSGAEEFAYNLKNLKRATLVGETTGGGANPGGIVRVGEHFGVFVPTGRAINPITNTNWEGTGVEPDVKVNAKLALLTAHRLALEKLIDREQRLGRRDGLLEVHANVERELSRLEREN